jgi:hypothetical protein
MAYHNLWTIRADRQRNICVVFVRQVFIRSSSFDYLKSEFYPGIQKLPEGAQIWNVKSNNYHLASTFFLSLKA